DRARPLGALRGRGRARARPRAVANQAWIRGTACPESAAPPGSCTASPQRRGACIRRGEQGGMRGAKPPANGDGPLLRALAVLGLGAALPAPGGRLAAGSAPAAPRLRAALPVHAEGCARGREAHR